MNFANAFHDDSTIIKELNSTFIALILKIKSPMTVRDFRPISLVGAMYKIMAKILANRLKKVMNTIISEPQMAVVEGRQITDSFVLADEIINKWKKDSQGGLVIKLDFEKAYDNMNHVFLDSIMDEGLSRVLHKVADMAMLKGEDFNGENPCSKAFWNLVVDKIESRLAPWKRIGRVADKNKGLLAKWVWRYSFEDRLLWKRVIFSREQGQWEGFLSVLQGFKIIEGIKDVLAWSFNPSVECSNHLFLLYGWSWRLWSTVMGWWEVKSCMSNLEMEWTEVIGKPGPVDIGGVLRDYTGQSCACSLIVSNSALFGMLIDIASDSKVAVSWIKDEGIDSLNFVNKVYDCRELIRTHSGVLCRLTVVSV
ncbi:hypothetical protein Ddye_009907 [Dipteronia dyeriana]|uniref:Reverse transcriptase domain-containing protein n=1 Tax=Dipteronia dyeriana TaxID=168575 RepID=A0AAD9XCI8_9ROSI|nr:hypothetical protein Ddye_009907 [Dipteronia dyeriana]